MLMYAIDADGVSDATSLAQKTCLTDVAAAVATPVCVAAAAVETKGATEVAETMEEATGSDHTYHMNTQSREGPNVSEDTHTPSEMECEASEMESEVNTGNVLDVVNDSDKGVTIKKLKLKKKSYC